jgi:hypothetical protein
MVEAIHYRSKIRGNHLEKISVVKFVVRTTNIFEEIIIFFHRYTLYVPMQKYVIHIVGYP